MKLWVYTICWNEAKMMPWFLRHYSSFAERIIVYDEQSTDGTRELVQACPKAELRQWPWHGLDDDRFLEAVNSWYKEARGKADWVMWPDVDELIYHPDIASVLNNTEFDVLPARGLALISKDGFPQSDTGQLYEHVQTGYPQQNYDKWITFRPSVDIRFTHGRHDIPVSNGRICHQFDLKLFHCHYMGIAGTAERNRRNYDRANNKRFAWNYTPEWIAKKHRGTETWVQDIIENHKLINVMDQPRKLHFGCGGRCLSGWENFDMEVDIRNPLPFPDSCASHVLAEHVVEHITHQQAWTFFEEAFRVLKPGGIIRVCVPDLCRMNFSMTQDYADAVKAGGHGDGSKRSALKAALFCHGHQAAYNQDLLSTMLEAVGFKPRNVLPRRSPDPALNDVDQHWKTVGESINLVETSVVEGIKP